MPLALLVLAVLPAALVLAGRRVARRRHDARVEQGLRLVLRLGAAELEHEQLRRRLGG